MSIFYLVLTFFSMSTGGATAIIPTPYWSLEQCRASGEAAKENYNGGSRVEWTCVPKGES